MLHKETYAASEPLPNNELGPVDVDLFPHVKAVVDECNPENLGFENGYDGIIPDIIRTLWRERQISKTPNLYGATRAVTVAKVVRYAFFTHWFDATDDLPPLEVYLPLAEKLLPVLDKYTEWVCENKFSI